MKIYIDIDDTICKGSGLDYTKAIPFKDRIKKINKLISELTHVGIDIHDFRPKGNRMEKLFLKLLKY